LRHPLPKMIFGFGLNATGLLTLSGERPKYSLVRVLRNYTLPHNIDGRWRRDVGSNLADGSKHILLDFNHLLLLFHKF
jgi:hypothetical protein